RSPASPPGFGRPLPARRSFCPGLEPGGTFIVTRPSSVGTSTCAPSAASHGESGNSISRSWPRARYNGCGSSTVCRSTSPAAPRAGAAEDAHLLEEVREIDVAQVLRAARAEAVEPVGRRAEVLPGAEAAQAVVGGALLLVAQRLVGLRHLLEFLLGVLLLGD